VILGGGIVALLASSKKNAAAAAVASAPPSPAPPVTPGTIAVVPPPGVTLAPSGQPTTGPGAHVAPLWDGTIPRPDVSTIPIPASYTASSALAEVTSIQAALREWALAIAYPGPEIAQMTPGVYDAATQQGVAQFQMWENAAGNGASLSIDGLAGPSTQTWLLDFGPLTKGAF
jgi:hypothetical protein